MSRILVVCTTDSMIWNFLVPHIKALEEDGHYVECACSETGPFFRELVDKFGIKMNKVCFKRTPYSFKNFKAYRNVCKLIRKDSIDTVFCHEPVGGAVGRLAGHKTKCKVVYMAHGFHFYKGAPKSKFLYKIIEKHLSKYTDTLITINQEDYEASLRFKAKRCIKTNGVGIDTSKFYCRPNKNYLRHELSLPDDSILFLSVGELIKRKNHVSFIKAIAKQSNKKIYYLIVGDGKLKAFLSKTIKKLSVEQNVLLLGYRKDISEICNSVDVFVMPSVQEGLSVALMEAMACRLPVIASNIRGNVDLIENKRGGELVSTFDVDGYVTAIQEIIHHASEYGSYNCKAVEPYDISLVVDSIRDIFR